MPKLSPVSYKHLAKVFAADGFLRPIVIPKYSSVPVFIITNNLRTSGMRRGRYFELPNQ